MDSPTQEKRPLKRARFSKTLVLSVAVAPVLVVLALALGLGLGLGLKKKHGSSSSSKTTPLGALVNSTQFTLDPSFQVTLTPTTREYDWTVSQINAAPAGVIKPMLVVNGISPGPKIEANPQDRIVVRVTNALNTTTTIHWHGLYQNGTNFYDGSEGITQCGIPPGTTFTYNFTLDGWSGTTWWHAHSATQYTDGLVGPIVVHNPADPTHADGELVVQLSDLYNTYSPTLLSAYLANDDIEVANEPVPDAGTLNGVGQFGSASCAFFPGAGCAATPAAQVFNFTLTPQHTYRLRLINSGSFAPVRFSVDNHTLTVVEADGTHVVPQDVAGVTVQVAQRYSVLLRTNQSEGAYWMRAVLDQSMFAYTNPALNPNTFGVLRYSSFGDTDAMPDMGLQNDGPLPPNPTFTSSAIVPMPTANSTASNNSTASTNSTISASNSTMSASNSTMSTSSVSNSTTPTATSNSTVPTTISNSTAPIATSNSTAPSATASATNATSTSNSTTSANMTMSTLGDLNDTTLVPADGSSAPAHADMLIPWTFSLQRTAQQNWRTFVNASSWVPLGNGSTLTNAVAEVANDGSRVFDGTQLITVVDTLAVVDFAINNLDDGDHPFHLHGYRPWIVGRGAGRYTGQALNATLALQRDVVLVPAFSWTVVRIVTDNPGYWAFHCHLQWHMAAGGLFQVAVQPARVAEMALPRDVVQGCAV